MPNTDFDKIGENNYTLNMNINIRSILPLAIFRGIFAVEDVFAKAMLMTSNLQMMLLINKQKR